MTPELNKARREATARDLDGWVMTNGTVGRDGGIMLMVGDKAGRPYAIGCGETELDAANALVDDMDKRARQWLKVRRMAKTWRDHLRREAEERRAEKSAAFLASRKSGPDNVQAMPSRP